MILTSLSCFPPVHNPCEFTPQHLLTILPQLDPTLSLSPRLNRRKKRRADIAVVGRQPHPPTPTPIPCTFAAHIITKVSCLFPVTFSLLPVVVAFTVRLVRGVNRRWFYCSICRCLSLFLKKCLLSLLHFYCVGVKAMMAWLTSSGLVDDAQQIRFSDPR